MKSSATTETALFSTDAVIEKLPTSTWTSGNTSLHPIWKCSAAQARFALLCGLLWLATVGCHRSNNASSTDTSNSQEPSALLVDVTRAAGIDFVHDANRKGEYLFPEINGAGCGFLDYDNDGNLDIYLVQSGKDLKQPNSQGKSNQLYRNRGDGTFENVTGQSGAGDTGYGQGMACGDYNSDGFVDIYVANVGGPSALLRNNGDGTFRNVAATAGVENGNWAIAPAFLDYDNDGQLDLFATNYVQWSVKENRVGRTKNGARDYAGPRSFPAMSAILYRNNGDETFSNVTEAAGINKAFGAGMGIICADVNNDSLIDVYVANDSWANQLWINQGDGTFKDRALEAGCALSSEGFGQASMGTNAEDLDDDGNLDLFTTNYHAQGAILYLQGSNGVFSDVSKQVRLFAPTAARTGFGACFFDLFNDGSSCVYIANGAAVAGGEIDALDDTYAQSDMVLQWSREAMAFHDITSQIGAAMKNAHTGRGVAIGDFDNDGAVDVLVSNNNGPAQLFRNTATGNNHWLSVRCLNTDGKTDAIGAKVFVTVDGETRRRDVIINYSYASASDPRIHFGLGSTRVVDRVRIEWPGGGESTLDDIPADQVLTVTRPVN